MAPSEARDSQTLQIIKLEKIRVLSRTHPPYNSSLSCASSFGPVHSRWQISRGYTTSCALQRALENENRRWDFLN